MTRRWLILVISRVFDWGWLIADVVRAKRRLLILVLSAIMLTGMTGAVLLSPWFWNWCNPPQLAIPADDEVTEMRACVLASDHGTFPVKAVPEFVVPPEHVPVVLGWLRPPQYIQRPWPLDTLAELGQLVIRTRDGRELRVRFFDAGCNPPVLTVDGVHQYYGRNEIGDLGGTPHGVFGGVALLFAVLRARDASQR